MNYEQRREQRRRSAAASSAGVSNVASARAQRHVFALSDTGRLEAVARFSLSRLGDP